MKTLEVRCCCIPKKLLGFLPVSDFVQAGQDYIFNYFANLENCGPYESQIRFSNVVDVMLTAEMFSENGSYRLALKSNDYSLETLRKIPGWKDADANT